MQSSRSQHNCIQTASLETPHSFRLSHLGVVLTAVIVDLDISFQCFAVDRGKHVVLVSKLHSRTDEFGVFNRASHGAHESWLDRHLTCPLGVICVRALEF